MDYRLATILDRESFDSDITKVIDINLLDKVSQIQLIHESQNGAEANTTLHPANCISKIELVDGSDVIFSLTGPETQAMDWYHRQLVPPNILFYLNNNWNVQNFFLNFGRYLYDPEYALDPTKFLNLQLKITIDVNAGGMNVDHGYLTVLAKIFDEKEVDPIGFLMHKQIKDYALGSATWEYTNLPTDYPYRKLLAAARVPGSGVEYCFGTIKLTEDSDRKVPINNSISEILNSIVGITPPYREWIIVAGGSSPKYFHITPGYWPGMSVSHWEQSAISTYATIWSGDGGYAKLMLSAVGGNYMVKVMGWCPHSAIEILSLNPQDPENWYDVTTLGNLRLDLKSHSDMSDSYSCQIFLQQVRSY